MLILYAYAMPVVGGRSPRAVKSVVRCQRCAITCFHLTDFRSFFFHYFPRHRCCGIWILILSASPMFFVARFNQPLGNNISSSSQRL